MASLQDAVIVGAAGGFALDGFGEGVGVLADGVTEAAEGVGVGVGVGVADAGVAVLGRAEVAATEGVGAALGAGVGEVQPATRARAAAAARGVRVMTGSIPASSAADQGSAGAQRPGRHPG